MAESRPASPAFVAKVAAFLIGVTGLITLATQWPVVRDYLFPKETILTWPFFSFSLLLCSFLVWFLVNQKWYIEYVRHQETKAQLANVTERFNASEQQRLVDVITGVANETKLIRDVESYFSTRSSSDMAQLILIDLRGFRDVNKKFGFLKGDALLRTIAQSLYQSMRRSEGIYKRTLDAKRLRPLWKRIYRKYPGGDEFVFLMEGQQPDAIGFVANRLVPQFKEFSEKTQHILGESISLSFHYGIAPLIKGDSFEDAFTKVQDCYMRATEMPGPFTIAWHPESIEERLPIGDFRRAFYDKIRRTFSVAETKA
jgi:GGDEF domain-containing protein